MPSKPVLQMLATSKTYASQRDPIRLLMGHLFGRMHQLAGQTVLHPLTLQIASGESLGIVGLNGAGKSTLLQLAAATLAPSTGTVQSSGRVAALLELGSGFNPEATGRENIFLYAATLGYQARQTATRVDDILLFSGLGAAIDQPVKTYSSGMLVRLAFTVATSIEPDLLIVDEALSVGDGVFAKRSFDRVLALREQGCALMLCSHALFHVDLFCDRTLWLHQGRVMGLGPTKDILPRYQDFLDELSQPPPDQAETAEPLNQSVPDSILGLTTAPNPGLVKLSQTVVRCDGVEGTELHGNGLHSVLQVDIGLQVSQEEPRPTVAVVVSSDTGKIIGSALSPPGLIVSQDARGNAQVSMTLPALALNQGRYRVGVYLLCEQQRFVYVWADPIAHLNISFSGPHQGPWLMPANWRTPTGVS